jgi:hypothetical protein
MTKYNVHLYREMRLEYVGIEADTPEAAVRIARAGLTEDADDIGESSEDLSARVEIDGDAPLERPLTIHFEPERHAARALLAACRMVVDRWEHGDLAEAARACSAAIAEAEEGGPKAEGDPAKKPYSVLLLYPDDVNDSGSETFFAWVEAPDSITAVAVARRKAVAAQEEGAEYYEPADFVPLLVIAGHHYGQPLSNN